MFSLSTVFLSLSFIPFSFINNLLFLYSFLRSLFLINVWFNTFHSWLRFHCTKFCLILQFIVTTKHAKLSSLQLNLSILFTTKQYSTAIFKLYICKSFTNPCSIVLYYPNTINFTTFTIEIK